MNFQNYLRVNLCVITGLDARKKSTAFRNMNLKDLEVGTTKSLGLGRDKTDSYIDTTLTGLSQDITASNIMVFYNISLYM